MMSGMFDRDSLYTSIFNAVYDGFPNAKYSEVIYLTDKISELVSEWVPKQGDLWLNEDDDVLYVNKGWEAVEVAKQGIRKYGQALRELAALEALDKLHEENNEGMKRLAND